MKHILVLLAVAVGLAFPQASQTVSFAEIIKQGATRAQKDSGYTWGQTNFFRSEVIDMRRVDSMQVFANAPDSFAVGITAVFYTSTDTTNGTTVAIIDSLTNVTSGVYGSNPVIATLTNQFWTTLKTKTLGGVPQYMRLVFTFNTTKNHDETAVATAEYFRLYAKYYLKPEPLTQPKR